MAKNKKWIWIIAIIILIIFLQPKKEMKKMVGENLVTNPGFESSGFWMESYQGGQAEIGTAISSYDASIKYSGSRSMKISSCSDTCDGDRSIWQSYRPSVTAGKQIKLSGWVRHTGCTSVPNAPCWVNPSYAGNLQISCSDRDGLGPVVEQGPSRSSSWSDRGGARLGIDFRNSAGDIISDCFIIYDWTKPSNTWSYIEGVAIVPPNVVDAIAWMQGFEYNSPGIVWLDDISLTIESEEILIEHYIEFTDPEKATSYNFKQGNANYYWGQTFTIGNTGSDIDFTLTKVRLNVGSDLINDSGEFSYIKNLTTIITTTDINGYPTITYLSQGIIFNPSVGWNDIIMDNTILNKSVKYALIAYSNSAVDSQGKISGESDTSSYTGGSIVYSYNKGSSWNIYNGDLLFEIYGIPIGTCIPNCINKQCGNDGCGGNCGTCLLGQTCISNTCETCNTLADTNCDGLVNYQEWRNYAIKYWAGEINFNSFIVGSNAWIVS